MAKKTNDNTIDFLYLNNKENNKKKTAKKKQKNNNVPKKTVPKNEIINLDNEIIIGLTPKKEQKQPKKELNKKNTNKKKPSAKQNKSKLQSNKSTKKPTIKLKILKWTSLFILLLGVIIMFMLSPIFNVKQINVEGNQKVSQEEIKNLSQIKLNENTFKINAKEVINKIQANTYIETVNITKELPSTVTITVKERVPQYIISIANGNAYVDSKGYILEISEEKLQIPNIIGYSTSIESIIDFQNTRKLSDEDCLKLEVVKEIIDAAKNNNISSYISSIDISDMNNIKVNIEEEKKIAYLGDASNANLRILYLKEIIEQEKNKEGEVFINGDINTLKPRPYFREKV